MRVPAPGTGAPDAIASSDGQAETLVDRRECERRTARIEHGGRERPRRLRDRAPFLALRASHIAARPKHRRNPRCAVCTRAGSIPNVVNTSCPRVAPAHPATGGRVKLRGNCDPTPRCRRHTELDDRACREGRRRPRLARYLAWRRIGAGGDPAHLPGRQTCSRWWTSCRTPTAEHSTASGPSTSFVQRIPFARSLVSAACCRCLRAPSSRSTFRPTSSSSRARTQSRRGCERIPGQVHVCYCYTPMRYAWDLRDQYLAAGGIDRGLQRLDREAHCCAAARMGPGGKRACRPLHRDIATRRPADPA